MQKVTARVPATTANLGPGFDCVGMALDLWNEVTIEPGQFGVTTIGEGESELPTGPRNLVVTGVEAAFAAAGKRTPSLHYTCINRIPHGRGLGSSSAAIVGGLVAGARMAGLCHDPHLLLKLAADIEGHPDNVAPAIFGGCCVGVHDGEEWVVDNVSIPEELNAVLFVPELQSNTHESRARLPQQISRTDAIYNIGRAAMLVNALSSGQLGLLRHATQDRLHQPQRSLAFPAFNHIVKAALNGGAHGAFLSGAGPTILALSTGREVTISYEMCEAARIAQVPGRGMILRTTRKGAHVVDGDECHE
ncbi:MAG: homoserine kinase [Dehalococcoidia bacterium]